MLTRVAEGTNLEQEDIKSIIFKTAREPDRAALFNHASMAHNNHIFFKNLSPSPEPMPDLVRQDLERSFSSIETLRREFVVTAMSMFGPGFVWLVKTANEHAILATYIAGSPYPYAHWRRQGADLNTLGARGTAADTLVAYSRAAAGQRREELPPGGVNALPVLCLNTWEHVWLRDYGIGGKRAFVEEWWKKINWLGVEELSRTTLPATPARRTLF
jgi:Fe-Mn family superoxide dismutase